MKAKVLGLVLCLGLFSGLFADVESDFQQAVSSNNLEKVKQAIEGGLNLHEKDGWGDPILIRFWMSHCSTDVIEMLIKAGADVNATGGGETTPLMFAATIGRADIVEILLKYKADINAQDVELKTALMFAVLVESDDVVKVLLNAGAEDKPDIMGLTAKDYAIEYDYKNILEVFAECGK